MPKIRVEVQQVTGGDSVAFETESAWDGDVIWSLTAGIEETIKSCDALGISLYQYAAQWLPKDLVDFQQFSRPEGMRCLTFKVAFDPGTARPDHPVLSKPAAG